MNNIFLHKIKEPNKFEFSYELMRCPYCYGTAAIGMTQAVIKIMSQSEVSVLFPGSISARFVLSLAGKYS
jgi:hypothetical protein